MGASVSSMLGQFVLLGTAPWLNLHQGIVSQKDRPWTQAAEEFRNFVLQAERQAVSEEEDQRQRSRPGARRHFVAARAVRRKE